MPADLPLASGDRVQLQQVIIDLTMNGADAMSSVTDRPRVLRGRIEGQRRREASRSRSGIQAPESRKRSVIASLIPLFTTKPTAWAWGCRSVEELSRRTVAGSGLRRARRTALNSSSRFPLRIGPRCLHDSWGNSDCCFVCLCCGHGGRFTAEPGKRYDAVFKGALPSSRQGHVE